MWKGEELRHIPVTMIPYVKSCSNNTLRGRDTRIIVDLTAMICSRCTESRTKTYLYIINKIFIEVVIRFICNVMRFIIKT